MASCTTIDMFDGLVGGFIDNYENALKNDDLTDVERADTEAVLKELRAFKDAAEAEDRDYIQAQGGIQAAREDQQRLLTRTFKETIGTDFEFTKGNNKKIHKGYLVAAKQVLGGIKLEFLEEGEALSYTFAPTSTGRSQSNVGSKGSVVIKDIRKFLDRYTYNAEGEAVILGNSSHSIKLSDSYKQEGYEHGDINHMRAMLKKMHLLGGEKASDKELDTYLDLLDRMSPEFFNGLNLYLKEKADRSGGSVAAKRMDITINPKPRQLGNQQSEASIYMEEVIHSMTSAALRSGTAKSKKLSYRLADLMEKARKEVSWRDFMPVESLDYEKEKEFANKLYDYIFDSKHSEDEFLAKALTVPEVSRALQKVDTSKWEESKRIWDKINDLLDWVVDIIKGNYTPSKDDKNVHEALVNLAFDLGGINNKAEIKAKEKGSYITKIWEVFQGWDEATARGLDNIKDKAFGNLVKEKLGPIPDTLYARMLWYGKLISMSLVNPVYREAMGAVATAWGLKPNSLIREVIGGMFATDQAQRVAEFLILQSGHIDKRRNDQIDLTRKSVLSEFDDPSTITREQEEAMTEVLADTDLGSLFGKSSIAKDQDIRKTVYDNKTIRTLLTDDHTLDRLIRDAKRALNELDHNHYYWHSNQAVGLGLYMATHRGTPEQNLNATNIAKGIHSTHSKKPTAKVVKAIDELATLVALRNTDAVYKEAVAELMRTDSKGVQHVADVIAGFKLNSEQTVFKESSTNQIKGYTREVFDDTIVREIAPAEDKAEMEAKGFTKVSNLAPRAGDKRNKPMALYVTDTASRPDRLRGGVRLNQITSKGTTITSLAHKDGEQFSGRMIREMARRDIHNIQRSAIARAAKMEKGEYDFKDTVFGVVPVISDSGKVSDYRYMMDKKTKKSLLKQDTRISEVMARSFGTLLDKDASANHNREVLSFIQEDMMKNWTSGTKGNNGMTDYTLIGPKVADPKMRELYYMLPKEFREFINAREDKVIAVRSTLRDMLFGYSHLSLADFPGIKQLTPAFMKKVIRFTEMLWMEMIKIVKTNILMKVPTILVSNVMSNAVYAVMSGQNPATLIPKWVQSYRNITRYNKEAKRKQEVENELRTTKVALERDNLSEQRKKTLKLELRKLKGELNTLDKRMKSSSIHRLVQLGMDQNVEDVTTDTEHDTNRIVNFIDEKMDAMPEFVRQGTDILFITKRTRFYKAANEFLEISDLIARDVQNQYSEAKAKKQTLKGEVLPDWWVEKQPEGYDPKQALNGADKARFLREAQKEREYELVEDYINYAKPSSRFEEYLNRVGILMFTKYVKRIQRIIMKNTSNAPLKALIGMLSFGFLGGYPSIHEQSFLVKDWYGDSLGPGNVFPIYGPPDQILTAITPALLKESTYDFLP